MTRVELIYDTDCPNVQHARRASLEGFNLVGLQPSWTSGIERRPRARPTRAGTVHRRSSWMGGIW